MVLIFVVMILISLYIRYYNPARSAKADM